MYQDPPAQQKAQQTIQQTEQQKDNKRYSNNNEKKGLTQNAPENPPEKKKRQRKTPDTCDEEWLNEVAQNPAYKGIDIRRELNKCEEYFRTMKIKPSRRRFLNWLNRVDKPIHQKYVKEKHAGAKKFMEDEYATK